VGKRMTLVTITTSRGFEAAHRQLHDTGKCSVLHGHNWVVDITLIGTPDPHVGYVIDLKDIHGVIDQLDHTTMLHRDDPLVEVLYHYDQKVVVFSVNATCENLCEIIANRIEAIASKRNVRLSYLKVTVHENSHSNAFIERTFSKHVR